LFHALPFSALHFKKQKKMAGNPAIDISAERLQSIKIGCFI